MTTRYVKTETGRQAIRDRAQTLSRPARNLLLILDGQKPGEEWVRLVNGSTPADLQQLIDAGMIEPVASAAAATPARTAAVASAVASAVAGAGAQAAPGAALGTAADAAADAGLPSQPPVDPAAALPLAERLQSVSYRHLYDTMTAQARPLLGLIKGYRMVLDVEKCNGPEEIRALALRFVDDVLAAQGVEAARRVAQQLCSATPAEA
ncbi:hypothetical protein [Aquabacterium sp.]|uniref:hypothetical protein n=1 Tax=Aquabacterium sp. TaxID=1872578 RepID=UPI003784ABE1